MVRGFELLCYFTGTFLPTNRMIMFVSSFLFSYSQLNSPQNLFYKLNNNSDIIEWSKFALMRLERLHDGKRDRKFVPGVEELTAIKVENSVKSIHLHQNKNPMICRVHMLDGSKKALYTDSLSTVLEVQQLLIDKLDLRDSSGFALFEVFRSSKAKDEDFGMEFSLMLLI